MNKIKTWVNIKPKQRWVRILFLYLLIAFTIGLTMKVVASSLATDKMLSMIEQRDGLISQGIPSSAYASLTQGIDDQSIGVYVGWSMIALKLYIYLTTFITLHKVIFKEHQVSQKWLWFMLARFFTLIIGLSAGEALTIYFTERNKVAGETLTGQQVFSYISPAMSIAFAIAVPPMIYQVIKFNK